MPSRLTCMVFIDFLFKELGEVPATILITTVTVAVALLASFLIRRFIAKHLKSTGVGALSLLANLVRVVFVLVVVFFLGENVYHVEMSGMVQALGVTTLVVSLGLQDLIKSVVAGLLVVGGNIVAIGDQVIIGDHRGEVIDINWHQVTIRDRDGIPHLLPNAELMGSSFMRVSGKMACRHMFECAVSPGANLQLVKIDMEAVAGNVLHKNGWNAPGYSPQVRFIGATAFGTTASVRIFVADIEYAPAAIDAVMCAIAERGYLSDTIRQVDPRWK